MSNISHNGKSGYCTTALVVRELCLDSIHYDHWLVKILTMFPALKEISRKFQTRSKSGKSQGMLILVREKSNFHGNSVKSQGTSWLWQFHKMFIKSGNFMAMTVSQSFQTLAFIFIMLELLTKEHSISLLELSAYFTLSIFTSGGFCIRWYLNMNQLLHNTVKTVN